jgi:hypothetical protein
LISYWTATTEPRSRCPMPAVTTPDTWEDTYRVTTPRERNPPTDPSSPSRSPRTDLVAIQYFAARSGALPEDSQAPTRQQIDLSALATTSKARRAPGGYI